MLGWWDSTVRVRLFGIPFRGRARGRGKDYREAPAGAGWPGGPGLLEAFAVGVRSLRGGSAMGTPTATPTATPTFRRSALQTILILGHNLRRETPKPHRTRFTLQDRGREPRRGRLPKRALLPPSLSKSPQLPSPPPPPIAGTSLLHIFFLPK